MNIRKGTAVTWTSAAGKLSGIVEDITLDYNTAKQIVPWLIIRRFDTKTNVMLCGTDGYLKAMNVETMKEAV